MDGVRTTEVDAASLLDEVLGNRVEAGTSRTVRVALSYFVQQLAGLVSVSALGGQPYPTVAAGLAASDEGQYFSVPDASTEAVITYRVVSGVATEVARTAGAGALADVSAALSALADSLGALATRNTVGAAQVQDGAIAQSHLAAALLTYLRARASHTGTQAQDTIDGLPTALSALSNALAILQAGAGADLMMAAASQDVPVGAVYRPNQIVVQAAAASRVIAPTYAVTAGDRLTVYSRWTPAPGETADPGEQIRVQGSNSAGSSSGISDYFTLSAGAWERHVITFSAAGNYRFGIYAMNHRAATIDFVTFRGDAYISPGVMPDTPGGRVLSGDILADIASTAGAGADILLGPAGTQPPVGAVYRPNQIVVQAAAASRVIAPAHVVAVDDKDTIYARWTPKPGVTADPGEQVRVQGSASSGSSSGVSDYFVLDAGVWRRFVIQYKVAGNYRPGFYLLNHRPGTLDYVILRGDAYLSPADMPATLPGRLLAGDVLSDVARGAETGGGAAAFTASLAGWLARTDTVYYDPYRAPQTTPFGFSAANAATKTGTVFTLGTGGYLNVNSDLIPAGLVHLAYEVLVTAAATQAYAITIRNAGGTTMATFAFDAANDTITVSGVGITTTVLATPSNLDISAAAGISILVLVLPTEREARLLLRYYDPAGATNVEKQALWYSPVFSWSAGTYQRTNEARGFQILPSGTGAFTVDTPVVFEPAFWEVGSSIVAGSDGANGGIQYSPFPGFYTRDRSWDEAYIRGRAINKWGINCGIASGGLAGVAAVLPVILWARPVVVAGDWGLTNNINNLDFNADAAANRAAVLADLSGKIDEVQAVGAVVVLDGLVQRNWSSDATDEVLDAEAQIANAAMAGWALTRGIIYVDHWPETAGVGTLPDATQYPDGTHPGPRGKRERTRRFCQALGDAAVAAYG